ncbi:MAG: hypothetical protein J7K01_04975 [Thermovirga sp.]|nr:hypothetical protein [Thermovirga sp.]
MQLQLSDDAIVIRRRYTLKELMSQVTPENIHGKIGTGRSVGSEEW